MSGNVNGWAVLDYTCKAVVYFYYKILKTLGVYISQRQVKYVEALLHECNDEIPFSWIHVHQYFVKHNDPHTGLQSKT